MYTIAIFTGIAAYKNRVVLTVARTTDIVVTRSHLLKCKTITNNEIRLISTSINR